MTREGGDRERIAGKRGDQEAADPELRAELMKRLVGLGEALNRPSSIAGVAAAVGRAALSLTDAQRVAVYLRSPTGVVTCPWSHDLSSEYVAQVVTPAGANPWAHLARHPELVCMDLPKGRRGQGADPTLMQDIGELPQGNEVRRLAEQEHFKALGSWPLIRAGRVIASVSCYYNDRHVWSSPEREVMLAFSSQAAAALEGALLSESRGHRTVEPAAESARVPEAQKQPEAESALVHELEKQLKAENACLSEAQMQLQDETVRLQETQKHLEAENARLLASMMQLEAAIAQAPDTMKQRIAELETENARLSGTQKQLEAENARLSGAHKQIQAENARLSEAHKQLETEKARLSEAQKQVETEKARLSEVQKQLEADNARLTGAHKQLEAENARLIASMMQLETAFTQMPDAMKQRMAELEAGNARPSGAQKQPEAGNARPSDAPGQRKAETAQLPDAQGQRKVEGARPPDAQGQPKEEPEDLNEFRNRLVGARTPEEVYQILADRAAGLLQADHEALTLLSPDQLVLMLALDAHDTYGGGDSERLARWAEATARMLGCSEEEIQDIRWGALLHDIGKICVPEAILRKSTGLTAEERAVARQEPVVAEKILKSVKGMQKVANILRHHYEKWDGTGYPDGLKKDAIPLGARVLAVVDAYSEMTSQRQGKVARPHRVALGELTRFASIHFDPRVVEAFGRTVQREIDQPGPAVSPAASDANGSTKADRPVKPGSRSIKPG